MSQVTSVTFNVPVVGWIINTASVTSPVKRRRRIMIHGGMMLGDGRFTSAVFTMKGRIYSIKNGQVFDTATSDLKMECMEVWVNDKWLRNDRTRRFAAWASNPKSETYWSS